MTGGEVIPNTRRAEQGSRVSLSVHPDSGYELDDLTITNSRGREISLRGSGNSFSFTMPASRVTIAAKFKKTQETAPSGGEDEPFTGLGTPGASGIVLNPSPMPFLDIQDGDWYYSSVDYVWKHYLMSGVSETQFAPAATTSRAMIWTVLARMNNVRTDVNPGGTWYERGMLWAMEQGVTDGSNPLGSITREQLAVMLWRNAGAPGSSGVDMSRFADFGSVSSYAQTALCWAVDIGVMNGANGLLNPQGTATRAEVAAMIMRYGELTGV
ncbi:MAG: S-layer homology domain-containing protein [Oscillospiraceae bacterium]|nr:S-layer homology domain-containing protein [Oscillospiraceae bacterium]